MNKSLGKISRKNIRNIVFLSGKFTGMAKVGYQHIKVEFTSLAQIRNFESGFLGGVEITYYR